jgi:DUF4097 and DUF4098 domain-containing protein YvlB
MDLWQRLNPRLEVSALIAVALVCSCVNIGGEWDRAKSERVVELSAALEQDAILEATTADGSITVTGQETSTCQGSATIKAHAQSVERAQQLANQTQVELVRTEQGLRVVPTLPVRTGHEWVEISLQLSVPRRTGVDLRSSDGRVHVEELTGTVKAQTSDGSITARRITGPVELQTSDGSIQCTSIEGLKLYAKTSDGGVEIMDSHCQQGEVHTNDGRIVCDQVAIPRLSCHASDGSIRVQYTQQATAVVDVDLSTSDGSIELACPPQVSASVEAHVGDGSIHSELPITVVGRMGKTLKGTVGKGEGRITLRTNDGSIRLR